VRGAPAVVREGKCDRGTRERDARERFVATREFGGLALQEFAASRRIEVEILDLHRRAGRERRGLDFGHGARVACDAPCVPLAGATAGDRQARDSADRSQRFPAKAQGRRALQVLERRNLAGGEARHGEGKVVALHADAVVDDAKTPHAALDQLHGDRLRACVEAVFEQLLEGRCGPLHHLAGGDLVHEKLGQAADDTHEANVTLAEQ